MERTLAAILESKDENNSRMFLALYPSGSLMARRAAICAKACSDRACKANVLFANLSAVKSRAEPDQTTGSMN